jgi:hypothetical protein
MDELTTFKPGDILERYAPPAIVVEVLLYNEPTKQYKLKCIEGDVEWLSEEFYEDRQSVNLFYGKNTKKIREHKLKKILG